MELLLERAMSTAFQSPVSKHFEEPFSHVFKLKGESHPKMCIELALPLLQTCCILRELHKEIGIWRVKSPSSLLVFIQGLLSA